MRSQPDREEQALTIVIALAVFAVVMVLFALLLPSDVHVPGAMIGGATVGRAMVVVGSLVVISRLAFKRR